MAMRSRKTAKHSGGHFAPTGSASSGSARGGGHFSSPGVADPSAEATRVGYRPATASRHGTASGHGPAGGRAGGRVRASRAKAPKGGGRRRGSRLLSNLLLAVGVILLLVAGGMWGYSQWRYHQQDVENEKLAAYATVSDSGDEAPKVDWEGLKKVNADVCGWIQIPGTVINYPVYQGTDNDYYLNTNAEGTYGVGGQIFLDYQCQNPGMQDQQTLVYGHHLKNGSMFKQVADMDSQEFFDSIKTVWYVTEDANYELEPLFLCYTDPNDTNVRKFDFTDADEFHAYLSDLLAKAVTKRSDADKIVSGVDHVLTLSTCNYIDGYGRTILVCAVKSEAATAVQGS